MQQFFSLGQTMGLDELSSELKRRIMARGLGPPRSFERWAEQILVDHPDCKALVLPAGTEIAGDLDLDHELFSENKISTVAALGPLIIQGRLINADNEGGPFLFVDGDLSARQIEKGGSSFIVLGNVACPGVVFCDYNQGAFLIAGSLKASAIISCDQEIHAGGDIEGVLVSEELGNMRELLVPEVFADTDDADDEFADGTLIRERLEAVLPVLKS